MANYESIKGFKLPEKVDVLIHNAGAMFDKRSFVEWGPHGMIDQTFALHVAGPFFLSTKKEN